MGLLTSFFMPMITASIGSLGAVVGAVPDFCFVI